MKQVFGFKVWLNNLGPQRSCVWTRIRGVFQVLFSVQQSGSYCHKHMSLVLTNGYKLILEQQEYGRGHILLHWHGTFKKERGATSHLRVITVHAYERGGGYSDNHNTSQYFQMPWFYCLIVGRKNVWLPPPPQMTSLLECSKHTWIADNWLFL